MKGEVLSRTDLLFMPEISLVLFMVVFAAALIWIYRPGSAQFYRQRSTMVFDEDETEVPHG